MKAMKTFAALLALAFSLAGCGGVDGDPVRPAPGSAGRGSSTAAFDADSADPEQLAAMRQLAGGNGDLAGVLYLGSVPERTTDVHAVLDSLPEQPRQFVADIPADRWVAAAGGGRVIVPAGRFLSGSVLLKDNVELHLESGAVLISSLNPADITPFPQGGDGTDPDDTADGWEGGFFLGASHAKNVTISGMGTIYGQGDKVFLDKNVDNGFHECPKFCEAFRPRMMLFEAVENFTVRDVTLQDAAFWTLHMAGCRHVRIQNIMILNDDRGANNDGIDPDCCQDVVISNCIVRTGDDAIVVKSTGPMSRRYGASENVAITGCILHSRDSALKIGTETHGVIRNVTLSDCVIDDCSRAVGVWVRDGGTVEDIHVHHLTGCTRRYADSYQLPSAPGWWGKGEPVFVSATPRKGKTGPAGVIRRVSFDHLYLTSESCAFAAGEPDSEIQDLRISEMHLTLQHRGTQPGGLFDEQPSARHIYPHAIPALYARCVDGLTVKDSTVRFVGENEAWDGSVAELEHCRRAKLDLEKLV